MTVHLYNTQTEPEHLEKDLSVVLSPENGYSGDFVDAVSIDNPVILIEDDIQIANYAYIAEFDRYYWIINKIAVRTGLTQLSLQSDPLMTFRTQIRALPLLVTRCERQALHVGDIGYNSMIPDNQQIVLARDIVQVKQIMSFAWSANVNLVTVG